MTDLQKALNEAMEDLREGIIKGYLLTHYDSPLHAYTLTTFFDDGDSESFEFSPQEIEIFKKTLDKILIMWYNNYRKEELINF